MLAGGGVGPFAGSSFAGQWAVQPDVEAPSWRVGDIADDPVAAFAVTIGEIVAAHSLGAARETVGELGGVGGHGVSSLTRPAARGAPPADNPPPRRPALLAR